MKDWSLSPKNPHSRHNIRNAARNRGRVADTYAELAEELAALAGYTDADQADIMSAPLVARREGAGRTAKGARVRPDTSPLELARFSGCSPAEARAVLQHADAVEAWLARSARLAAFGGGTPEERAALQRDKPAGVLPSHYATPTPLAGMRGPERRVRIWSKRGQAMRACGDADAVWTAADGELLVDGEGKPVIRGVRCESRFCTRCAARSSAKTFRTLRPVFENELEQLAAAGRERREPWAFVEDLERRASPLVFATFARAADGDESIFDAYDALNRALDKLRHSRVWKRRIRAAMVKVEVTRSDERTRNKRAKGYREKASRIEDAVRDVAASSGGFLPEWAARERDAAAGLRAQVGRLQGQAGAHWHMHAHMVLVPTEGRPLSGEELTALWDVLLPLWAECLELGPDAVDEGGRPACTVRLEKPRAALRELAKYLTKPVGLVDLERDALRDLLVWAEGRRMVRTWGDWYARPDMTAALDDLDEKDPTTTPESADEAVIGFRFSSRTFVRTREAVLRTDDATTEQARMVRALLWEQRREARGRGDGATPPDDAAGRIAATWHDAAHVAELRLVESDGVVEVRGQTSAASLRELARHLEEQSIEAKYRRTQRNGIEDAPGIVALEIIDGDGVVRTMHVPEGAAIACGAEPLFDEVTDMWGDDE